MVSYKALNTTIEAPISQTRDGVGNGDGGQTAATMKAFSSQTRDGVGNGDGGQTATLMEAVSAQTRDGIGYTIIDYCFGNHYIASVFTIISVISVPLKGDSSRLITCV